MSDGDAGAGPSEEVAVLGVRGQSVLGGDVPNWQKRSVERSLRSARARAQQRTDRLVAAALELITQSPDNDFTIQEVLDRCTMSVRTFYNFFDGKDSLLLAVYETVLTTTAVPLLRERCAQQADPVLRLRTVFDVVAEITETPHPLARALSLFHLRLAQNRPEDLTHALSPLRNFLAELLNGVAAAGLLRADLEPSTLAVMTQQLLITDAYTTVLAGARRTSMEDLWAFCSAAILVPLPLR
jgi:AcrR family transcriptional regulator